MLAKNPMIYSDFPDPEVIRVEDTYYLVTTTMHFFPGGQILMSKDLVNWQHLCYAYEIFGETMQQQLRNGHIYGQGMWAPTLRYHGGIFHLVFSCNDTKSCYHFTAADMRGPWKMGKIEGFYHDPSLLFDDDGRVYIVYGNRDIRITELKQDLSAPLPDGLNRILIHDEEEGLGWEGSHIHKIGGRYYLCNIHWPKGKMRSQGVHSCDSLTGEFIGGEVLMDDLDGSFRGVAQGGMVDTPEGKWYMPLFQDHGAQGRMPVLVPFTWENHMPKMEKAPRVLDIPVDETVPRLYTSDSLLSGISFLWQWNHEPDKTCIAYTEKGLQLICDGPARDVEFARNTLTQRCFNEACSGQVTVDVSALREGDHAGICALQGCFAQLCVTVRGGQKFLSLVSREAGEGTLCRSTEPPQERQAIPFAGNSITLRAVFDFTCGQVQFFFDDGGGMKPFGNAHRLVYRLDHFTGCRMGLCAFNEKGRGGHAVFRDFVYQVHGET
ncbi:MAG: family 43 glycosylhydrolase [Clostridia bacterium]|nr:family 43 glycosylhydrolase [Clostridia bacterium]